MILAVPRLALFLLHPKSRAFHLGSISDLARAGFVPATAASSSFASSTSFTTIVSSSHRRHEQATSQPLSRRTVVFHKSASNNPNAGRRCPTAFSAASSSSATEPMSMLSRSELASSSSSDPQALNDGSASATSVQHTSDESNHNINNDNGDDSEDAQFAQFRIPASSLFYRSPFSVSFVNLRPIVPGHVLVMPRRCVPLLRDLTPDEYDDLWRTVRETQRVLSMAYPGTSAFNVAVQDGPGAGQSVPHVHVHVLPRATGDFERNDDIYESLEVWAPRSVDAEEISRRQRRLVVQDDDQRRDRTAHEMEQEAAQYRRAAAALEGTTNDSNE